VGLLGPALETKRLQLLHQFVPGDAPICVLVNPMNPAADLQLRELHEAAGVIKRQIIIVHVSTELDFETAFATASKQMAAVLLVVQDPFYNSQREQLVAIAARYKLPVMYPLREFAEIGGLVSYDLFAWRSKMITHKTAIFRQINKAYLTAHHDALEFPDGQIVLLTALVEGQKATVLQLPAEPKTESEAEAQERAAYAG